MSIPILICPERNADESMLPGGWIEELYKSKNQVIEIRQFDQDHGWVPRGDTSIPEVERDVRRARDLYIEFFDRYV